MSGQTVRILESGTDGTNPPAITLEALLAEVGQAKVQPVTATEPAAILEARAEGREFEVIVIEAGLSKNKRLYEPDVLKEAARLFEGSRVQAYTFDAAGWHDHLPLNAAAQAREKGLVGNLVGFLENVRYGTFLRRNGTKGEGLLATLKVVDADYRQKLRNVMEAGRPDLLGLSVDVAGEQQKAVLDGQVVDRVLRIAQVTSTDLVSAPAAGGALIRMVASASHLGTEGGRDVDVKALLALIKKHFPRLLEGVDEEKVTEEQLQGIFAKAMESAQAAQATAAGATGGSAGATGTAGTAATGTPAGQTDPNAAAAAAGAAGQGAREAHTGTAGAAGTTVAAGTGTANPAGAAPAGVKPEELAALKESLELLRCERILEQHMARETLPECIRKTIAARYANRVFTAEELQAECNTWREGLAALDPSGQVTGMGGQGRDARVTREAIDKIQAALDLTIGYVPNETDRAQYDGIRAFGGIREAYFRFTGDADVEGRYIRRITEAVTGDFPLALGTSMNRRLRREYPLMDHQYEKLCDIIPLRDFKLQETIQFGSFADLAIVAERDPYLPLANPTEARETYVPRKRGGTWELTRESILADDLRMFRRVPTELAKAASRTLSKFVFDLLLGWDGQDINGAVMADALPIYSADPLRANLLAVPLDFDSLNEAITLMMQQRPLDRPDDYTGVRPKYLVVPIALRPIAEIILKSDKRPGGADNDFNIVRGACEPIVSAHMRGDDVNWFCVADYREQDTIELGFIGGRREPELLMQDNPAVGMVFSHDLITYKIRHEYGGCVVDHRGFVGSIVP